MEFARSNIQKSPLRKPVSPRDAKKATALLDGFHFMLSGSTSKSGATSRGPDIPVKGNSVSADRA
jgi:hypothetical protein